MDDNVSSKSVNKLEEVSLKFSEAQSAKDYMKSFSVPKPMKVKIRTSLVRPDTPKQTSLRKEIVEDIVSPEEVNGSSAECDITENQCVIEQNNDEHEQLDNNEFNDISFDDDFDVDNIKEDAEPSEASKTKEQNHITEENLVSGWETMQEGVENMKQEEDTVDISELPLVTNSSGDKVNKNSK